MYVRIRSAVLYVYDTPAFVERVDEGIVVYVSVEQNQYRIAPLPPTSAFQISSHVVQWRHRIINIEDEQDVGESTEIERTQDNGVGRRDERPAHEDA